LGVTYKKIDCLTSLRFFGAAAIVIHHSRGTLWLTPENLNHFALDQAVSFFYVLSGFVLTYVYPKIEDVSAAKQFYLARFARIWPAHITAFATLFIIFLPSSLHQIMQPGNVLIGTLNILLIQAWFPRADIFFSFNSVTWAVSVEVFFYLLFPVMIMNFEKTWRGKLLAAFLIVVGLVILCNVTQLPSYGIAAPDAISSTALLYIHPLARLFEFVVGMCVALFYKKYSEQANLGALAGTLLETLVFGVAISTVYYAASVHVLAGFIGLAGSEYLYHAGSCLPFALLIFIMALQKGLISRVLGTRIPLLLGEASYSIFLFHQIILRYYFANASLFSSVPQPLLYALFWIFLLMVSFVALMVIERPCRRLIINRWPKITNVLSESR
jgi:peptidoglycan/LPS O-acetylase OafA/YrhL